MRSLRAFLLCSGLLLTAQTGCGWLVEFDTRVPIPEQTVPSAAPGGLGALLPIDLLPPVPVRLSQTQDFEDQEVEKVSSLRLTRLTLALTDESQAQNFNFVDRIQIDARAKEGSRRVHVAGLDPVPRDLRSLSLKTTRNELADIMGADFELIVEMEGRFPIEEAKFDGTAEFEVLAEPEGLLGAVY